MALKFYTKFAGVMDEDRSARVGWIQRNFERYEAYWKPELERQIRNARMYWGVNFGMWPIAAVEKLRAHGRRPPTFPVSTDKIESLVGNFIQNTFDIKLEPITNKHSTLTYKAQDIITSQKHNMDWETSKIMCLLDSFIMVGYERMLISDQKNPFGDLAFENLNPRHVLLCPGWKSNYIADLRDYIVWDKKSIPDIKRIYNKTSAHLNELEDREKADGLDYGVSYGPVPRWRSIEDKWSGDHLVIEYHHVQDTERFYEYDKKNQQFFPDNKFKLGSEEDRVSKLMYVQQMELSVDDIVLLKQKKRVKFIEAIAPDIDKELFLDNGKDLVQTNNCNLYPLGVRYYGHYQGIMDRLYDLQIGVNKSEMNIQDIQTRSAKGAFLLDRALSGGDPELERQIEQSWNDPAARIWVDEFATERLPKGGIIALPGVTPTSDMFTQPNRYYDLIDRFSKVPAAQDARTESSQESGRLYKFKFEAGNIQQKFLMRFYEAHEKSKITAVILQAKITFAGVPRQFNLPGGNDSIEINIEGIDLSTGKSVVLDDISALPEMNVILIPSKQSVSIRDDVKQVSGELLQMTKDPLIQLVLMEQIALASELVSDEEAKEGIVNAFNLAIQEAATAKMVNIKSAKSQLVKLDAALEVQQKQQDPNMAVQGEEQPPQQMSFKPGAEQAQEQAVAGTQQEQTQPQTQTA